MKAAIATLLILIGSFAANADEVRIASPIRVDPIGQCRLVTIKRTTIYVDRYGHEVYREVSYRRAYLCEQHPSCRRCHE